MFDDAFAPYVLLIVFGFLPSVFWKFLGAFFAHGIDETSETLVFVRAVATALLAGVACKLLVAPSGALAHVPIAARLGALATGLAAFALFRRSVVAGVLAGEAAIMAAAWGFGG